MLRLDRLREPQAERCLAGELAEDWGRLVAGSAPAPERILELLDATDRLPLTAWPQVAATRVTQAAAMLAAIGRLPERSSLAGERVLEVTDQLLFRLITDLTQRPDLLPEEADLLLGAWEQLPGTRRLTLTLALTASASRGAAERLEFRTRDALTHTSPEVSSLLSLLHRDTHQATRLRDLRLLLAHLLIRRGATEEAIAELGRESAGCLLCAATAAELLDALGRHDEATSWLLRALVGEQPLAVRQRLFDRAWAAQDWSAALDQIAAIVEASPDAAAWPGFRSRIEAEQPELLDRATELLRQRAAEPYLALLLREGSDEEILRCAQSKSLSAARLWEIADLLRERLPADASKLYERALQMQGVAAVNRLEMIAFLERVREVTPFFEQLGRPTKAHRIARDAAAVSKCGAALKREYEHFFGSRL